MNDMIDLQLENAQIFCLRHINNEEVNQENFIHQDFIIRIIRVYYEMIDNNLRNDFSFDDFKNELVKRFEKNNPHKHLPKNIWKPG